jgi:uncharacterized membrane protein YbhN (UPF0104 family)
VTAVTPARATPKKHTRASWRLGIIIAVQLVCVGWVGRSLWSSRLELSDALRVGTLPVLALLGLNALGHVQRTLEFTYTLRRLGVSEPFLEGFLLTGAGLLLNHLPLNAGLVMRAVVLERDYALPYSSYLSMTLVNIIVNVAVAAVIGLTGVCFASFASGEVHWTILVLLSLVLLGCALSVCVPHRGVPGGSGRIIGYVRKLADGIELIRGDGRALGVLLGLAIAKTLTMSVRLWLCFSMLNTRLSPVDASMLASIQNLIGLVNITPGNWGLRELLVAAASTELGTRRSIGMAAASIDRLINILYVLASGLPGVFSLRRRGPLRAGAENVGTLND